MKLSLLTTLAVSLAPVYSYLELSASDHKSLNGQFLFRRGSPPPTGGSGNSPPRTPVSAPSGNPPQTPQAPQGARPQASQHAPEIPHLSTLLGGRTRPARQRRPPRPPPSDGDSDSSEGMPNRSMRSKSKVTATGPGSVNWSSDMDPSGSKPLAQDEKFKKSVRGSQGTDMRVHLTEGNPPGKAKVNIRSQKRLSAWVSSSSGEGEGKITPTEPAEAPVHVRPGGNEHAGIRTPRGTRATRRFKTELKGAGSINTETSD